MADDPRRFVLVEASTSQHFGQRLTSTDETDDGVNFVFRFQILRFLGGSLSQLQDPIFLQMRLCLGTDFENARSIDCSVFRGCCTNGSIPYDIESYVADERSTVNFIQIPEWSACRKHGRHRRAMTEEGQFVIHLT
jgi:hypothetical protein